MREKLEQLLSGVPGEFKHHPRLFTGFDQLMVFRDKGIPCPDFTLQLEEAKKWVTAGNEVFGRNKIHEKGQDIVDQPSSDWAGKEFWTKVIAATEEYRIHIFDGEHIQQALKKFDPDAVKKRTDGLPIRNTETGWAYDHSFNPSDNAVCLAKRAVRALGYLWGAVDFLEDAGGNCYVLEVNTAPGMDATTVGAYASAIERYVGKSASRSGGHRTNSNSAR